MITTPAGEKKFVGATFAEDTFPSFLEDGEDGTMMSGSKGGVPKQLASLVICVVVLLYVFFGGMRGTAWANTFQTLVFMVLGIVTFYVIATKLGGKESFLENLQYVSGAVSEEKATRSGISQIKFLTYMFVPLSVGMFPHLFQHWLTARSADSFRLPVVAHPLFIMIVWVPCVLVGVWATTDLIQVPPPVQANPNIVLPFMVKKLAGPVLGGFLTAGILAAIMSSLDSQFLCIGTIFTEDMVVHYGGKNRFSDSQIVIMARIFIIVIVALTYFFSLYDPRRVFTLGVWCFSGFSSLFPLVFAALYWKRLTKAGAYACVLTAITIWCYLFWRSDYAAIANFTVNFGNGGSFMSFTQPGEELGENVIQVMPVALMILCSTLAMIVVSLITPTPKRETIDRFFPPTSSAGQ